MVALPGLQARQAARSGLLGRIGFVVTLIATTALAVLFAAVGVAETFFGFGPEDNPAAGLILMVGFSTFLAGVFLFGIATARAGVFPRGAALLLALGLPVGLAIDLLTGAFSSEKAMPWGFYIGPPAFAVGLIWLGYEARSGRGTTLGIYSSDVYLGLRRQALSTRRAKVGIPAPPPEAPAWGILMETGYRWGTATLFALSDGTTSLYLSSGGGIIGGHAHEGVRQANAALIRTANQYCQHLKLGESFPLPATEQTTFYVLTDSGVLTGGGLEEDLVSGRHLLSPLFHAGHEVIMQVRLISESADHDV